MHVLVGETAVQDHSEHLPRQDVTTTTTTMQGKSLDRLIADLSTPNRYQICLLILLGLNYIPLVFNHVIMAFFKYTPPHQCGVSTPIPSSNLSSYKNLTVLQEWKGKCSSELYLETGENITVKCQAGQWKYSPLHGENSIVSEWDLVCEDQGLAGLATTVYFAGVMAGGLLFGFLSDLVGRRPVLLLTLFLPAGLGLGMAFAPTFLVFVLLRFLQGVLMQGLQTSTYVLAMEFFMPEQRPMVAAVIECFWGATVMVLPGLAFALPNWRHLQVAISLPPVLLLFYLCIIPESLRWLLLKRRMVEARRLVEKVASFNGIPVPEAVWGVVSKEADKYGQLSEQKFHFVHLFRTPRLRRRTLLLFYIWLTITTGYYGLTFSIVSLPGNKYVNFFISGAVEFVHYALSMWIMKRFGRKKPLLVCFIAAGLCCIVAAAIPKGTGKHEQLKHVSTAFAIVGRFFMGGLFSIIFVYTTELYPTVIRNIGMGACLFWARLGGVIAPQINQLGAGSVVLVPILVFGCMMLLGGALLLLLPETHRHKLPDVIADVEEGEEAHRVVLEEDPLATQELVIQNGSVKTSQEEEVEEEVEENEHVA
ncbi:solute carrier family 22 member 13-like [Babylonia areolata]|uniref:solute carrier family 22 member 13-like n=1 Tax=Babylonia areolata TaxID=304850 RepID=UPI003FCF8310